MRIYEILGENFSGAFAGVAMPMTPGTKKKDAERSVYGKPKKSKSESKKPKMGYSADVGNLTYNKPVKNIMIKR